VTRRIIPEEPSPGNRGSFPLVAMSMARDLTPRKLVGFPCNCRKRPAGARQIVRRNVDFALQ